MAHVLYRFYSATGQLLYVGITMNPPQRFKAHRQTKDWWGEVAGITIEHYASREDLANAERRAIRVEHPLHNVVHARAAAPPIAEPDEPPTSAIDEDLAALFASDPTEPTSLDWVAGLFPGRHETRFGYVTEQEYERRCAQERAKGAARDACTFCDSQGYRGMVVCDHVDRWSDTPPQLHIVRDGGE